MKEIVVASINPVKINAALGGFNKMFRGEEFVARGISVPSGVSDQPMSQGETLLGAMNRVKAAKEVDNHADYWVGLEGGVEELGDEMVSVVWAVVASIDRIGKGKPGSFVLPPRMVELLRQGLEMGEADDVIFGTTNSKQKNGAIGLLTKDTLDRTALYEHGIILALIPFVNPDLFPAQFPW